MSDRPLEGGGSPSVSPADDVDPSSSSSSHLDYHRDAGGSSASPWVCRQQERRSASNQTRSWLFCGFPLSLADDLQDLSVARRRAASVVSHVAPSTRLCLAQQTTYWPRSTTADALLVSLAWILCLQVHPGAGVSFVAGFFCEHSLPGQRGQQQEEVQTSWRP